MSTASVFGQKIEAQSEVTFVLRFLQVNQESRGTLAGKRGPIRGSLTDASAFDRTDSMGVHLFRADARVDDDISNLKAQGSIDELSTVRMIALLGREAIWVVGGKEVVPTIPVDDTAPQKPVSVRVFEREFGLRLSLVAWSLTDGGLRVRVRPTVKAVDFAQSSIRRERFEPSLISRRTDTYIDVKLGQSFAITGALDGDLLAKLARSKAVADDPIFQAISERSRSRPGSALLLVVTPESVQARSTQTENR